VSYNSEVLIIWHFRFLPENNFISETGLRDMFKEVFKNVSTVISPDPHSIKFFSCEHSEGTKEGLDNTDPADCDIYMN